MINFDEYVSAQDSHVWRYIKYRAAMEKVSLIEASRSSLAHMYDIANRIDTNLAIITAFRHENIDSNRSQSSNRVLNQKLLADIRGLGYGSIPVAGGFKEDVLDDVGKPTGEKVRVEEDSFLINAGIRPTFREDILSLVQKYNQDAAIVKYAGDDLAKLLQKDGSELVMGKWNHSKLAMYYTRMVKGPSNREFTFEAAGDLSVMTQTAIYIFERNLEK
jgi:hypothetical protein